MAEFMAFNKDVEVNGQTILSVLDGMKGYEESALKILARNGIQNINQDQWYSQQSWLNAFKEIANNIGSKTILNIGMMVPENAQWPPDVISIESAFQSIDIAYHMNHRLNKLPLFNQSTGVMHEGIGHYTYQKTGTNEITMVCNNPYPCDFDKGIIKSVANKFKPAGTNPNFFEKVNSGCRKKGENGCTYVISW